MRSEKGRDVMTKSVEVQGSALFQGSGKSERIMLRGVLDLHLNLPLPPPRELDSRRLSSRREKVGNHRNAETGRNSSFKQYQPRKQLQKLQWSVSHARDLSRVAAVLGTGTDGHSPVSRREAAEPRV